MTLLKLLEYRKNANLTQADVSQRLNVSQSYYSRLEKGKHFPDAKQIKELCEIFNCSPNDLFGFKGLHKVVISELKNTDKE